MMDITVKAGKDNNILNIKRLMFMTYNEKNYPIRGLWIFKSFVSVLPIMFVVTYVARVAAQTLKAGDPITEIYMAIFILLIISLFSLPIMALLRRLTFCYTFQDKVIVFRQGIFPKQQRVILFGVLQNVVVQQSFVDRILGLASLSLDNVAQGARKTTMKRCWNSFSRFYFEDQPFPLEARGFFEKNKVVIPGLALKDAEALKEIILSKMKESPIDDKEPG